MPLPHFIIAGERRCGTTTLASQLAGHPDIFIHPKRDRGWFVDDTARNRFVGGVDWESTHTLDDYSAWFAEGGAPGCGLVAEKSADYLFWQPAHDRLARYLPNAKFIVTLRNPVERAWSHYWNEVAKGRERLEFEAALAAEDERAASSDYERFTQSYRARGEYDVSLERFFNTVGRDRVMVVTVEALRQRGPEILAGICRFVGADPGYAFQQDSRAHNVNWAVQHRPWARSGLFRPLANGWCAAMRQGVKLVASDRTRRRELLVKASRPFFVPARDQQIATGTRLRLSQHFASHTARLADLVCQPFDDWG